ncbi:MAG: asparagine synthase (glutamine-hydrolyzing) [Actinomycetota bacterium]|nr:asparagine synthase (glutamine-hydrolyzing) [Actinomycetota bacterium]
MCGITGILATSDSLAISEELVAEMRDTLPHRGPDDAGAWYSGPGRVALGHRRLSIVDLSAAGHQPMCNEDGTVWITYNGEVYNHAALREELEAKGHAYRSNTDTETIVHLYEEEGIDCVKRLQGMFGFAIWDARRRELFLARDRMGIKPVYYATPPGGFLFGSEIKAILRHPAMTAELDEEAFQSYLTFLCTPPPATLFAGVSKLAPAERMVVDARGSIRRDTFWTPFSEAALNEVPEMSEAEMEERLLDLLRASIEKRMMADVPFGVFLSGGVDSSTNVALMSEVMDSPVRTFSIAFHGDERTNELPYARQIAERFGADHHEVLIGESDLQDFLPELIYHQDEPIADYVCLPLYFVSKLARDSGTIVVQIGEGSDELFHGYDHYADYVSLGRRLWQPATRLPRPLRVAAGRAATGLALRTGRGMTAAQLLVSAGRDQLPFWGGYIAYRGLLKDRVVANGHRDDSYALVERLWREAERLHPGADQLQKMTYLELRQRLAELLLMRVDKMTMATSVEARVPFLDHELVEFATALPPEMKVRDGVGKHLLKKAVTGVLPREIVYRTKQGFSTPMAEWFRGDLGERAQREIRGSSLAERGLLDYDEIDRTWAGHRSGRIDRAVELWALYNVSAWHDRWVAGREPVA